MNTSIKAYAKINIALNILNRREDGYHDLDMVMIPIDLHDIIELERLPHGYESYLTSDDQDLPTDESNFSHVAFTKMKSEFNIDKNYMITIHKRIPMNAGLGGGSADAAAVINGTLKSLKLKADEERLVEIAKSIGADVPFCLFNKPARCRGIGEKMEFFSLKKKYHVLLIKPREGVSTAEAYKTYDHLGTKPEHSNIEALMEALQNDDEEVIAREMKNSLQDATVILLPIVQEVVDTLKNDGFNMTLMSGSGSTVFTMHKSRSKLINEAKKFDKSKFQVIITSTL